MLWRHFGGEQPVRYWCQDETRLGLKTLTGRTITLKGVKPSGIVRWQRQNFYLYGLVEPATGDSFFWEFSDLDAVCFQDFLNLFSTAYPDSLNFIQMDNGSFHKSLVLKWPDNVIPIFQPSHSPELNIPAAGELFTDHTNKAPLLVWVVRWWSIFLPILTR